MIDTDYAGKKRNDAKPSAGPFESPNRAAEDQGLVTRTSGLERRCKISQVFRTLHTQFEPARSSILCSGSPKEQSAYAKNRVGIRRLCGVRGLTPAARAQRGGCSGPDGSRFNLEPRPNAVVQAAQSVAFLPNGANGDLVVATATDMRGLAGSTTSSMCSGPARGACQTWKADCRASTTSSICSFRSALRR